MVSWDSLWGNTICSFRQFLAKLCRFATIQNVTDDDRQTDRRHSVPKTPLRSAKNEIQLNLLSDYQNNKSRTKSQKKKHNTVTSRSEIMDQELTAGESGSAVAWS